MYLFTTKAAERIRTSVGGLRVVALVEKVLRGFQSVGVWTAGVQRFNVQCGQISRMRVLVDVFSQTEQVCVVLDEGEQ